MLSKYLFKQALFSDARSLARRFREKRMRYFEQEFFRAAFGDALNNDPSRIIRILDIGGTYDFWNALAFRYLNRCEITLLNLEKRGNGESMPNVRFMAGNATDLSVFGDGTFDLVFSNSCIEHIGRFPEWRKMADGMRRVGSHYFLQTPNRHFPLEPHFMFPFFQFLPLPVRAWLFQHFDLGYFPKKRRPGSLPAGSGQHPPFVPARSETPVSRRTGEAGTAAGPDQILHDPQSSAGLPTKAQGAKPCTVLNCIATTAK